MIAVAPTNPVPATHTVLGQTLDGRDMDLITVSPLRILGPIKHRNIFDIF